MRRRPHRRFLAGSVASTSSIALLFLLAGNGFCAGDFALKRPIPRPETGRHEHATCYTANGAVPLFGGDSAGILGDAWICRLSTPGPSRAEKATDRSVAIHRVRLVAQSMR